MNQSKNEHQRPAIETVLEELGVGKCHCRQKLSRKGKLSVRHMFNEMLPIRQTHIMRAFIQMKSHFTYAKVCPKCQLFCIFNVVFAKSLVLLATIRKQQTLFFGLFVISQKFKSCLHLIWTCSTQTFWRILRSFMGSWFRKNKQQICALKTRKMKSRKNNQFQESSHLNKALA